MGATELTLLAATPIARRGRRRRAAREVNWSAVRS
jgi:hypothetical protein